MHILVDAPSNLPDALQSRIEHEDPSRRSC